MDVTEVQPKRDTSSREIQKRREPSVDIDRPGIAVIPNHVDAGRGNEPADQEINHWQFNANYAPQEDNRRQGYLLDKVTELYHKLLDRRQFMLSDFKPLKSIFSDEHQTSSSTQPFKLTRESEARLRKREMVLVGHFMQSLRALSGFSPDDKFALFKQFSMQFIHVEICYRTYLNDGVQKNSFTMATGEILCLDNLGQLLERFATKILDAATLEKLCHSMIIQGMRGLVEPMTAMKMTEREMLAFSLILLYNSQNANDLGLDQQNALMKARNEVLDDLHQYYCDNKIEDGEIRLGNLILLVPAVLDWSYKMKEQTQIARIFEPYSADENLCELYELH
uniref:NR LBD domain-containing protein n=1 Tax=Plectus sambesii TaxID=2011161 RepID=A0A914UHA2_9BILA